MSMLMRRCRQWYSMLAYMLYLQCDAFFSCESLIYTCIRINTLTVINMQEFVLVSCAETHLKRELCPLSKLIRYIHSYGLLQSKNIS